MTCVANQRRHYDKANGAAAQDPASKGGGGCPARGLHEIFVIESHGRLVNILVS